MERCANTQMEVLPSLLSIIFWKGHCWKTHRFLFAKVAVRVKGMIEEWYGTWILNATSTALALAK